MEPEVGSPRPKFKSSIAANANHCTVPRGSAEIKFYLHYNYYEIFEALLSRALSDVRRVSFQFEKDRRENAITNF